MTWRNYLKSRVMWLSFRDEWNPLLGGSERHRQSGIVRSRWQDWSRWGECCLTCVSISAFGSLFWKGQVALEASIFPPLPHVQVCAFAFEYKWRPEFEIGLLWIMLDWQASVLQGSSRLRPSSSGMTALCCAVVPGLLHGCWGPGFSCLCRPWRSSSLAAEYICFMFWLDPYQIRTWH